MGTENIYIDNTLFPACVGIRVGDDDLNFYPYPKNIMFFKWYLNSPDGVIPAESMGIYWVDGGKEFVSPTNWGIININGSPVSDYPSLVTLISAIFFDAGGGGGGGGGDASAANQGLEIGHLSNIQTTSNTAATYLTSIDGTATGIHTDTTAINTAVGLVKTYIFNQNHAFLVRSVNLLLTGQSFVIQQYEMVIGGIYSSNSTKLSLTDLGIVPGGTNAGVVKPNERVILLGIDNTFSGLTAAVLQTYTTTRTFTNTSPGAATFFIAISID
jgi:hypothetical protein